MCLLVGALGLVSAAAAAGSKGDIHYLAEHLAETGHDARNLSLTLPIDFDDSLDRGAWRLRVATGYQTGAAEFLELEGTLASVEFRRARGDRDAFSFFAYFDFFAVGGQGGEQELGSGGLAGIPLTLPARAWFENPRGDLRRQGVGVAWQRRLFAAGRPRPWFLGGGLTVDRLELDGYEMDYVISAGPDAGASGVVDHSGTATSATPFLGLATARMLGRRLLLVPQLVVGGSVPANPFERRITGPGFDRSSRDGDGEPGKIGDAFLGLGARFLGRSGWEVDLGTLVSYPLWESTTHPGVRRALLLHVGWTFR